MARDVSPPPIISDRQILPQQIIYLWKGNLSSSRIHFKYWKNILISQLYEQFCEITPQWLQKGCPKKFQTFKYEHIIYSFEARGLVIPSV